MTLLEGVSCGRSSLVFLQRPLEESSRRLRHQHSLQLLCSEAECKVDYGTILAGISALPTSMKHSSTDTFLTSDDQVGKPSLSFRPDCNFGNQSANFPNAAQWMSPLIYPEPSAVLSSPWRPYSSLGLGHVCWLVTFVFHYSVPHIFIAEIWCYCPHWYEKSLLCSVI
jgi:hypothetical protein